jgi:AhpD family alkylhydroperoxidase
VEHAMQNTEWAECYVTPRPDPVLNSEYRKTTGAVVPGLEYMTTCDWLSRSFLALDMNRGLLLHTDHDFAELVWLAVSQDNSCRYCYAAHRTFLQLLGKSEKQIKSLEEALFTAELSDREERALQFARKVSRASPHLRLPGGAPPPQR